MPPRPAIAWFRQDLRLTDNPALAAARKTGAPIAPLFVLDETLAYPAGAASRWWLHHSLKALSDDLAKLGAPLILRQGSAAEIIPLLAQEANASHVFWNRRYFPDHVDADKKLKADLTAAGVEVHTFNGALLCEPWEIKTNAGGPFRVFTPFWRKLRAANPARVGLVPRPRSLVAATHDALKSDRLKDWGLVPHAPDWAGEFANVWTPGEAGARRRIGEFLDHAIGAYKDGRDRPDKEHTSRLSPHLAFGEISPRQVWRAIETETDKGAVNDSDGEKFFSELAWREFSYSLLYHNPSLPEAPLRKEFAHFPWRDDADGFAAWKTGRTGYPIVDAGMRQLWRTGWMHNRVRMIAASFLIKDLLIPWQDGAAWFWDTLVDADLANNSASWQWVAGCGADASPYFRIFNPVTQGEKFDPDGNYVRKYVPELKNMPAKHIHAPWRAPAAILDKAGVKLGQSYPYPVVDHATARKRALEEYDRMKRVKQ